MLRVVDPYWQSANTLPKDSLKISGPVPSVHDKSTHELSSADKDALLSQYNDKVCPATIVFSYFHYPVRYYIWFHTGNKHLREELQDYRSSLEASEKSV